MYGVNIDNTLSCWLSANLRPLPSDFRRPSICSPLTSIRRASFILFCIFHIFWLLCILHKSLFQLRLHSSMHHLAVSEGDAFTLGFIRKRLIKANKSPLSQNLHLSSFAYNLLLIRHLSGRQIIYMLQQSCHCHWCPPFFLASKSQFSLNNFISKLVCII